MPNGFAGTAAKLFLTNAQVAHQRAVGAVEQNRTDNRELRIQPLPFDPEDAENGRAVVGRRSVSNIVVNRGEYTSISHEIARLDDEVGECLHKCAVELEEMCNTIFIVPGATPQLLNINYEMKQALNAFRETTESMAVQTRRFANEMTGIGGGE